MGKQRGSKHNNSKAKSKGANKNHSSTNNGNNNNNISNNNSINKKKQRQKKSGANMTMTTSSGVVDDSQFRNTLLNEGQLVRDMNADGNCLFRALSDQLYHDLGAMHDQVRNDVCNHLERNKDEFYGFLLMDDADEDVMDFQDYVSKMRQDGEWGGNVELVAAAQTYRRDIKVFSAVGAWSIECGLDESHRAGDPLLLSFHENDHYNSVHPLNPLLTHSSPPLPSASASFQNTQANVMPNNSSCAKVPTRGSQCPCGSGLKYKKCCLSRQKTQKRMAKLMAHDGNDNGIMERRKQQQTMEPKKQEEYIGNFKVLSI